MQVFFRFLQVGLQGDAGAFPAFELRLVHEFRENVESKVLQAVRFHIQVDEDLRLAGPAEDMTEPGFGLFHAVLIIKRTDP